MLLVFLRSTSRIGCVGRQEGRQRREAMPKGDLAYSFFEELYLKSGDLHEIEDGIFIGSAKAAHDYKVLAQHRISHILIVHGGLEPKFPGKFRYKKLNVPDLPYYELRECLPEAFEFFEDAFSKGRPHILVHCQKGISRSTSVALAWMMRSKGYSFDVAWSKAEKKRATCFPNVGFQVQLRALEALWKEKGKDADLSALSQTPETVSAVIAADAGKRLSDLLCFF